MIDCREQIIQVLLDICPTVRAPGSEADADGKIHLPMIVYAEIANAKQGTFTEQIIFQIDAYGHDLEETITMTAAINNTMEALGFFRTYTSPDTAARIEKGLYKKTTSYTTTVNTITGETSGNFCK